MNRNLDGVYFRVKRNDVWESVCFSDMTKTERLSVMENKDKEWLKEMCNIMADEIKRIGDELDIVGVEIKELGDEL